MSAFPEHGPTRRWRRLVVVSILGISLVAGGWWIFHTPPQFAPVPPDVPSDGIDPELTQALTAARNIVQENPHSVEAWGRLGILFLANGRNREADVCLRQCENLDQRNPRWPYYLALANIETNADETMACLRRAIERCNNVDPEVTAPHLQLATLLVQEGRYEEAEDFLRIIQAKEPGNPQAIYLSALLHESRNDLRGSVALLRLVGEQPATRQKACTKLAQLHQRLGDTETGEVWANIARSLPADSPWPDTYRAELRQMVVGQAQRLDHVAHLQDEGRYDEAVALLDQMIRNKEPGLEKIYAVLGNNLVHLARGPEAVRAYEEALRLEPNSAEVHNRLALVHMFQGELRENQFADKEGAKSHHQRALTSARAAVRYNPQLGEAQLTLGQILLYLGQRQDGIAALRLCLHSRPENPTAHLLLGEALVADNQPGEARLHLEAAVRFADKDDRRPKQALERFQDNHGKK